MNQFPNGIRKPTNEMKVYKKYYDTSDIIQVIIDADKVNKSYTSDFAHTMRKRSRVETCRAIWKFIKENIEYREDKDGIQDIKSPGKLFHDGYGDCKSFSNFIASCLKNLQIPFFYRLISERYSDDLHHIYIVAIDEDGTEIPIDAVYSRFNAEVPYKKKRDILKGNSKIGNIEIKKITMSPLLKAGIAAVVVLGVINLINE